MGELKPCLWVDKAVWGPFQFHIEGTLPHELHYCLLRVKMDQEWMAKMLCAGKLTTLEILHQAPTVQAGCKLAFDGMRFKTETRRTTGTLVRTVGPPKTEPGGEARIQSPTHRK